VLAVCRIEDRAAAGGQHDAGLQGQVVDDGAFARPEARLTLEFEDQRYVRPGALFDFAVAVEEVAFEQTRELASDGGLAGPQGPTRNTLPGMLFMPGMVCQKDWRLTSQDAA